MQGLAGGDGARAADGLSDSRPGPLSTDSLPGPLSHSLPHSTSFPDPRTTPQVGELKALKKELREASEAIGARKERFTSVETELEQQRGQRQRIFQRARLDEVQSSQRCPRTSALTLYPLPSPFTLPLRPVCVGDFWTFPERRFLLAPYGAFTAPYSEAELVL